MLNQISVDQVFNTIEKKEERIAKLLSELIQVPTVVPPGNNYEEFVDLVEPIFRELGFKTERVMIPEEFTKTIPYPIEGPRVNLVASRDYGQKEDVTIYAHMDVVPIDEPWTMDPFAGIIKEGIVFGRGALDMKSGIASMITAIEVLNELNLTPNFNIICTLCTDEELGVYPGIYHLAKHGYVKGHLINTELGAQLPLLIAAAAGVFNVSIRTKGRSAHSGMNFMGINAIEEMVPIMNELLKLKTEVEARESEIPTVPAFKTLGGPSVQMTPMFNLDIIRGGTKANIVPSECELVINRRYIPEETFDEALKEIEEAVKRGQEKSKALSVEIKTDHDAPPFKTNLKSPYLRKIAKSLKTVHGFKDSDIIYAGISGSTDMGYVYEVIDSIDIIGIGAATLNIEQVHGVDESVPISALLNMTKQLVHYLAF
ncbi:MAG: M20 family metallopeptidase [Promethearchaeota archaeon]